MAKPLRCSTCGAVVEGFARQCGTCGAQDPVGRPMTWAKSCPRCGHQGYGDHYFSKAQHIALLVVLGLATSGLGALIYWLVRFQHRLCPRCGLNWRHASYRPLPFPDADLGPGAGETTPIRYREPPNATMFAPPEDRSAEGWVRIGGGALLGFAGASMVSSSLIVSAPVAFAMLGAGVVVGGAALIWSGIARCAGGGGPPVGCGGTSSVWPASAAAV